MVTVRHIYVLLDPSGDVRYVGVTKGKLSQRLGGHVHEAKANAMPSHRLRWLRKLIAAGERPTIRAWCSVLPQARWQDVEIAVIAQMREAGIDLVNGTIGGDGTTGRDWRPNAEQRQRMSEVARGKVATEATRSKRSQSLLARYADPVEMAKRQDICRAAARSDAARETASKRMKRIWADPVLAAEMSERMRGSKARRAAS